jgi:HEAT repeat protein
MASTGNEAALGALVPGLDSPWPAVRHRSLEALLTRRNPAGHREVIGRLHTLDARGRAILGRHPGRMIQTLRDAVLSSDPQFCANGCRAAVWLGEYDLVPTLVNALEDHANPNAEVVAETLRQLTGQLYDELAEGEARVGRDPQVFRRRTVAALEASVQRFGRHKRPEIVEAFVLLVKRDNAALKQILGDPHHAAFLALVDALSRGTSGGVIRLLLSFLDDPAAPTVALSVLAKRTDRPMVGHLLKKIGREPSQVVARNLKRITSVAWVDGRSGLLAGLDDAAQHAAVRLVMTSGVPRDRALEVVGHLLAEGTPGGRRAAAEALAEFHGAAANAMALEALEDPDPYVQAAVARQLRHRGITGALGRLLQMAESPHAAVRSAVRESLTEFSFTRFLASYDVLEDDVRQSTGALVKRIDPKTVPLLRAEMESPLRSRRLRAVAIARSVDAVAELEEALVGLLEDEDHMVRARAAEALAEGVSVTSRDALGRALSDESAAVQAAARASLDRRTRID